MSEELGKEETMSGISSDLEGTITHYGKGAVSIFQWQPEEVVGKQKVTIFHKKEHVNELVPRLLKTAAETGEFKEEVILVRKNGEEFKAVLSVRPIKREGQIVGYVGMTKPL